MPICHHCRTGFETSDRRCPSCGTPAPVPVPAAFVPNEHRCGSIGMYSLWITWIATLIGAVVAVVAGVISIAGGQWLTGTLVLLFVAPVSYGNHVAIGLAIRYARHE